MVTLGILRWRCTFRLEPGHPGSVRNHLLPPLLGFISFVSRGKVGVILGVDALSGIWVRVLPSGPRPWRYPGGRGFGCVGRSFEGGEGVGARDW